MSNSLSNLLYTIYFILHPILPCSEKQNAEAEKIDLDQLLSILNSQIAQEQAEKQSLIHRPLITSPPFVWPSPFFPIPKGTANAQEEEQAQAQIIGIGTLLAIAIAGALVGAGAGRALDEIPLQEQARAQGPLGGLSQKQLNELMQLVQEMAPMING